MKRVVRWALAPVLACWYVGTLALWRLVGWADDA